MRTVKELLRLGDVVGKELLLKRDVEAEHEQIRQVAPRVGLRRDERRQRRGDLVRRLVAILRRRRHRARDHLAEQQRHLRIQPRGVGQRRVGRLLGAPAGQHLPQHHAQREHVGAVVDLLAFPGLGRDIAAPPDDHARVGDPPVDRRARSAEIDQLHVTGERQHDVLGRHVAVNDPQPAKPVRMRERAGDRADHVNRDDDRQRPHPQLPHHLPQVHPFDELLHDAELTVDLLDPQRARDVLVLEPRRDLRLPPEPRLLLLVMQRPVQPFDHTDGGILLVDPQRHLHPPHPAGARKAHDEVGTKLNMFAGVSHWARVLGRKLISPAIDWRHSWLAIDVVRREGGLRCRRAGGGSGQVVRVGRAESGTAPPRP